MYVFSFLYRLMKHLDPSECLPIPLTTIKELSDTKYHFKTCLNTSSVHQWRRLRYERSQCKNPCNVVEYVGCSQERLDKDDKTSLILIIYFVSNEIKMQDQYFIYSDVQRISNQSSLGLISPISPTSPGMDWVTGCTTFVSKPFM